MTILRYQYPKWPGEWDGTETVTNFGTFDFDLQDVLDVLWKEQERVQQSLPISYGFHAWKSQYAILLKLIERVNRQDLTQHKIVVWDHKTREWPIEKLVREEDHWHEEGRRLSQEVDEKRLTAKEVRELVRFPDFFEDAWFGDLLSRLVVKQNYLKVFCPLCEMDYISPQCSVEAWVTNYTPVYDQGTKGENLICPRIHTLYVQMTASIGTARAR